MHADLARCTQAGDGLQHLVIFAQTRDLFSLRKTRFVTTLELKGNCLQNLRDTTLSTGLSRRRKN